MMSTEKRRFAAPIIILLVHSLCSQITSINAEELRFFIGTYTGGKSKGIYSATLDTDSGKVTPPKLVAEMRNPSFLAIHPSGQFLYAVEEATEYEGKKSGAVAAFKITADSGALSLLNKKPSDGGAPCHLVVDQKGKFVLVANYVGGNVGSLAINDNGKLGAMKGFVQHEGSSVTPRQKGPHAHSINLDANNRIAVAADLGIDKLISYRLTKLGELKSIAEFVEKPGAGPRHFAFHPNGKLGYLLNEMNATVSALAYDSNSGEFKLLHTLGTLPKDFSGRKSCAEIQVHPTGKFLYCSNRGHDSIAVFKINDNGKLTRLEIVKTKGQEPRNFAIDPTGKFLLAENQKSDSIAIFRINQKSGQLTATGQIVQVPTPVCVKFLN